MARYHAAQCATASFASTRFARIGSCSVAQPDANASTKTATRQVLPRRVATRSRVRFRIRIMPHIVMAVDARVQSPGQCVFPDPAREFASGRGVRTYIAHARGQAPPAHLSVSARSPEQAPDMRT